MFAIESPKLGMDFSGEEGKARKEAMLVEFVSRCEEKEARTREEIEDVAYGFFSNRVKERELWWDGPYTAPEARRWQVETGEELPVEIPDEAREFIVREYESRGKKPEEEEIQAAYRKNYGKFRGSQYE